MNEEELEVALLGRVLSEEEREELARCECGTPFSEVNYKSCECGRVGCTNAHCAGCDRIRFGFGPAGCPL